MTRTPKNPAAEVTPVPHRRVARTVPGEPAVAPGPPRGTAAGGKTSPQPQERAAARTTAPAPVTGDADPAAGDRLPASPGRGRTQTPAGRAEPSSALPAGTSAIVAAMSEAELEIHVRHLIKDLGLLWYHTHDSRRSPSGFPDLVIVGDRVIYRELKTAKGKVADDQAAWLDALVLAEQDACVWRPADLLSGLIGRQLAALAGLRAGAAS